MFRVFLHEGHVIVFALQSAPHFGQIDAVFLDALPACGRGLNFVATRNTNGIMSGIKMVKMVHTTLVGREYIFLALLKIRKAMIIEKPIIIRRITEPEGQVL